MIFETCVDQNLRKASDVIKKIIQQPSAQKRCFKNFEGPGKPGGLECQELGQDFCNYDSTGSQLSFQVGDTKLEIFLPKYPLTYPN